MSRKVAIAGAVAAVIGSFYAVVSYHFPRNDAVTSVSRDGVGLPQTVRPNSEPRQAVIQTSSGNGSPNINGSGNTVNGR